MAAMDHKVTKAAKDIKVAKVKDIKDIKVIRVMVTKEGRVFRAQVYIIGKRALWSKCGQFVEWTPP